MGRRSAVFDLAGVEGFRALGGFGGFADVRHHPVELVVQRFGIEQGRSRQPLELGARFRGIQHVAGLVHAELFQDASRA